MLVYRVELPDGTGPWCNPNGGRHNYTAGTPPEYKSLASWSSPCSISVSWPQHEREYWRFGFTSWKQFFDYCNGGKLDTRRKCKLEALNIIKEKEMVISVYEVDDKHVIDDAYSQCVFRIAEATLVERLDSLSDVVMEQLSIYLGEPTKKEKDEQEAGDISFINYSSNPCKEITI